MCPYEAETMATGHGEQTRTQRRAQRTFRGLIDAGERIFGVNGFHDVTISDITEEADVALGSFYNYFENRDGLIAAVLDEAMQTQLEMVRLFTGDSIDPARRLTAALASQIHRARLDPEWAALTDAAAMARRWPNAGLRARAESELAAGQQQKVFAFADLDWSVGLVLAISRAVFDPAIRSLDWSLDHELATILSSLFQVVGLHEEAALENIRWACDLPIDLDLVNRIRGGDASLKDS